MDSSSTSSDASHAAAAAHTRAQKALQLAGRLQDERFGLYAVSLGFSRTLMSVPSSSTSSEIPEAERLAMGLTPGLLRLSIGLIGDDEILTDRFLKAYRAILG